MAFSVSNFRSNLKGDGARPAFFEVTITNSGKSGVQSDFTTLNFLAKASSIPASTVNEKVVSYKGHDVKFAGMRTFEDWTITVYNDEDFKIRNAFEKWSNAIDQHTGAGRTSAVGVTPGGYAGEGFVKQLSKDGSTVLKSYKFVNIWPSSIATIALDWDTKDEIETFDVTFKYDYYVTEAIGSSAVTTS